MSESFQVVLVTLVALGALMVLLRPLWMRKRTPTPKSGGCSTCGSDTAAGRSASSADR